MERLFLFMDRYCLFMNRSELRVLCLSVNRYPSIYVLSLAYLTVHNQTGHVVFWREQKTELDRPSAVSRYRQKQNFIRVYYFVW